jgi:thiol-disulfide isomerase/thioredoxin
MHRSVIALFFLGLLLISGTYAPSEVRVVKFDALEHLMTRDTDKIEVINFWATWCKPCIKELPYFQELQEELPDKVNVTLVSLDYAEVLNDRVIPFIKKRQLTTDVLLLDEIDYNSWIDKVDPSWSGAIPATLIINHQTGQRKFIESELEPGELEQFIEELTI